VDTRSKFLRSFWHPLRQRKSLAFLLIAATLLIIASSSILLVNATTTNRPESKAQMTATARAQKALATAHVYAAATARIYATSTTIAAATATVAAQYPDSYPPHNNAMLLMYDPLTSQSANQWGTGSDQHIPESCQFINGAYHAKEASTQYAYRCTPSIAISNFAFEARMTILSGDCGGITFRDDQNGHYYLFQVCQDSTFEFFISTDTNGNGKQLISTTSSAIKRGLKQSNILAVVANGANIDLYANHTKIYSTTDKTYSEGAIALYASEFNSSTDVAYNDAKLWGV
jgi:hypothetical protein